MAISRAALSKIHIARQQLGLDDDTYRTLLARIAGVRSSKELTDRTAGAVLREFERLGFQPKPGRRSHGRPHNFSSDAMPELITKIEAQLADMKLPWSYADGIARQMFGVQRVAWTRQPKQLRAIVAALHVEQERRQLLAWVEELMQKLDLVRPGWRGHLEELPKGWQRNRPTLKRVIKQLEGRLAADGGQEVASEEVPA